MVLNLKIKLRKINIKVDIEKLENLIKYPKIPILLGSNFYVIESNFQHQI